MTGNATLIVNAKLALPDGLARGSLLVRDGRIEATGDVPCDESCEVLDVRGSYVLPGLVDIHVHGAAGASFNDASPETWQRIIAAHRERGTTSLLATLASATPEALHAALTTGARLVEESLPTLAGVHLEGPYLNPMQRGAHSAECLLAPSRDSWLPLLRSARRALRLMTLAPELPGALELVRGLRQDGVVVSAGHSDAGSAELRAATDAGLSHVAHLWSGQSQLRRNGPWRAMGLLELALSSRHLTAELIADGVHAPPELTTIAYRCFGKDRLCLISDASAGTGTPCGTHFDMGSACGVVADGVAVTQDGSAFCGSTSFLLDVLRFCATSAEIPLAECSVMASGTPARVAGIEHARGQLKPRLFADLIVLDERLALTGVMTEGRWLAGVGVS